MTTRKRLTQIEFVKVYEWVRANKEKVAGSTYDHAREIVVKRSGIKTEGEVSSSTMRQIMQDLEIPCSREVSDLTNGTAGVFATAIMQLIQATDARSYIDDETFGRLASMSEHE